MRRKGKKRVRMRSGGAGALDPEATDPGAAEEATAKAAGADTRKEINPNEYKGGGKFHV